MEVERMSALPQLQQQVTPQRILQMGWSFALPFTIESAVRNRIFDVLDAGPQTLEQICVQTGCSRRGAEAVLNLLVSIELLSKDRHGKYALTPESEAFLVSTKPGFQGGFFRHLSKSLVPQFLNLDEVTRTGEPARKANTHAEDAAFFKGFVADLFPMNFAAAQAVAKHLAASRKTETKHVLDLAAGSGVWGIAMAQTFPNAQLTAVDYPEVLEVTHAYAQKFGLGSRYREIAGDLLQVGFGTGYSVAILGHILHSEGDERSRDLLRKTYSALDAGGTIVICEFLFHEDRTSPPQAAIFNVNMLVNTEGGRAYSFEEIREWLTEFGFQNIRLLDVPAPSPLILAEK